MSIELIILAYLLIGIIVSGSVKKVNNIFYIIIFHLSLFAWPVFLIALISIKISQKKNKLYNKEKT